MLGEWMTIPGPLMGSNLPDWRNRPGDEPQERTERVIGPNGLAAQVVLRVERVALHWRVVDHTFAGPATGPAIEGLERFVTREAAKEAADEWLAAWRAKYLLGVPG